jgi:mevalonate kinase
VPQSIIAKAPASVMLFGEHAVLRNSLAIVAAIDCPLEISLTPRSDQKISLESSLGNVTTTTSLLSFGTQFRFIEACFRRHPPLSGATLKISSSINPTVGLGSSAAVTVALLAALRAWQQLPDDKQALLSESCDVIREVQGYGSGADAASIIWGGVISYHAESLTVSPLTSHIDLSLVYSGKKTPTADVIRYVNEREAQFPKIYTNIFSTIHGITQEAAKAIQQKNWPLCGELMNIAHGLMEALGVGTPELSSICWNLRSISSIFGAKISGSGLGDAAIGLGLLPQSIFVDRRLPSTVSPQGVSVC